MSSNCPSNLKLEEFSSSFKSMKYFYQIMTMKGSAYVWVGTESGQQNCVVAAVTPRYQTSGGIVPVTTLVPGSAEDMNVSCASRLEVKLGFPLILSLNIPEDAQVLEHVEKSVLDKLS